VADEIDVLANDIGLAQRAAKQAGSSLTVAYKQTLEVFMERASLLPGDILCGIRGRITDPNSDLLLGASRGAAIWSVRDKDTTWFKLGLGALLLENGTRDYRESITDACLMMHSAQKLSTNLTSSFEQVRRLGDPTTTSFQGIELIVRTCQADLSEFGYVEAVDRTGAFTYQQERP